MAFTIPQRSADISSRACIPISPYRNVFILLNGEGKGVGVGVGGGDGGGKGGGKGRKEGCWRGWCLCQW
jgi:hypothetical protein